LTEPASTHAIRHQRSGWSCWRLNSAVMPGCRRLAPSIRSCTEAARPCRNARLIFGHNCVPTRNGGTDTQPKCEPLVPHLLMASSFLVSTSAKGLDRFCVKVHVGGMETPGHSHATPPASEPSGPQAATAPAAYGGATGPDPTPTALHVAELRSRIAALEADYARALQAQALHLETEIARLHSATKPGLSEEMAERRREPLTPAYVGRALVAVEGHMADMERFAEVGDDDAARESKVAAVSRACSVLKRLCDDEDFHSILITMQGEVTAHEASISTVVDGYLPDRTSNASFRDFEIEVLQLAGLPKLLARLHIDEAAAAYNREPGGWQDRMKNPMTFLSDLRRLRDASCLTADLLAQGTRHERSRERWRKLLTFGLGGTLIVVANGVGTALLGPVGVAASGAIGSAAIGVAAQLVS
jgi:hypothetical protein